MTLAFLNIGTQEMVLIVIVILMLFGGKKLPELARGLGRGIREFKDASEGIKKEISDQINNFEKDLDVTAEDPAVTAQAQPTTAVEAAKATDGAEAGEATAEVLETATAGEEPKAFPQFSAPENTFQHAAEQKPESGDSHYTYGYTDHFATPAAELANASTPAAEEVHATGEEDKLADVDKKQDTTQKA